MHFPPINNLGFVAPVRVAPTATVTRTIAPTGRAAPITFTNASGWAKRPMIQVPIKYRPLGPVVGPVFDRGAVPIPARGIPPLVGPTATEQELFDNLPRDQFRYSNDQIREMIARGKSETTERSGESDSGLPNALDLEQTANENDAARQYEKDAAGGSFAVSTNSTTGADSVTKPGNALLLAGLMFLLFGG